MKGLRRAICMVASALVVGALVPASASAEDYFLKIDGITGESTSVKFPGSIELESWSWGISKDSSRPANAQDFHFVKQAGSSSPKLFEATAAGTLFPKAKLTAVRGPTQFPLIRYCFTGVRMSSYQTGGSDGSPTLPMEQISFSYATAVSAFQLQDPDGSLGETVFGGWDFINRIRFGDPSC